jgi:hypothetical protein
MDMNVKNKTERLALAAAAFCILALLAVAAFAGGSFAFFGPMSRVLTPNGDGANDQAVFCFDNPADSDVSGKVYTLLGSEVASLGPRLLVAGCPKDAINSSQPNALTWDGRSNGQTVSSGVYVYRITSEGQTHSGTLVVVR